MSNKWILLLCFVLVTMGAADGRKKTGRRNSKKGRTQASPCYCRDKDGCKKGSSCPSGCSTGWAAEQCKNSTFFVESCKYNENHVLTCKAACPNGSWDGPYCSRENVMKKSRLQNRKIDDKCMKIRKAPEFLRIPPTDNPAIEFFPGNSSILNISDCAVGVSSKKNGTNQCSCTHLPTGQTFAGTHLFTCQDGKCSNVKFLTVDCGETKKPPAQLCLSEIEVYSCKKFWFGPETGCRSHCNCQNGAPCNPMSEECPRENPCADGFFGTNCSLVCGPCDGNRTCDKTTGQCPQILTDLPPRSSTSSEPETSTSSSTSTSPPTLTSMDSIPATPRTYSTHVMDTSEAVASSGSTSDTDSIFSATPTALPQTSTLTVAPPSTSGSDSMTVTPSALHTAVSDISTIGVADSASSVTEDSSIPTIVLTTSITSTIPDISDKLSTDSVVSGDFNAKGIAGVTNASLSTDSSSLSSRGMVGFEGTTTDLKSSVTTTNLSVITETDEGSGTSVSNITPTAEPSMNPKGTTDEHFSGKSSTGRMSTKPTLTTPFTTTFTYFSPDIPTSQTPPPILTERTTPTTTMPKQSTQTTQQTTHTSSTHQTNSETVSTTAPTTQEGSSTPKTGAPPTPDKRRTDGGSTEYTVAGVLFGLAACVLVAIIAFVFVYRRLMRRKMNTSCEQPIVIENRWDDDHSGAVTMSSLLQNEAQEDTAVYANCGQKFELTVTPIPVANFRNHIGHLESTGGYAKEFQALPTNRQSAVEAATRSLDADVRKNRFKDICPYDDTRVVLTAEKDSDSDYINASYIDGFAETRAYIAAQGPLPDTVGDFWHMAWTEGCGKIVMLTNLSESGKVKCEQYWPNEENYTTTYGHYTVTLVNVTTHAFFVQRTLRVVKNTSQNGDGDRRRHIHHFHFTAWPDHNVPLAAPMVEFWEMFHHVPSGLSGPLLVHCSAGVGRTGTFIGLDILIRQAETRDTISVFPTVRRMRLQRVKMVQTLSQYVFLHEVLDEWLSSRDTVVSLHDLQHDPAWCLNDGGQLTDTVRAKTAAQFQLLDRLRPRPSKKLTDTALQPENASKNRVAHILPMEHCRVCLWSPEEEDSDYINAVFLPSMATQLGFIVTQLPLRDTAADFWHMVHDWRAKIVVRFLSTPEQESDLALCPAEGCRAKFGPVTVGNDCVSPWKPGITEITLQLQSEEVEQHTQMVKVYSVDHDMTLSLTDTSPFLTLADHLLPIVGSLSQPPVVVQCFDGVGLSCTLCAVVTALQTLQVDGRASPYTLVRTLQTCRPQAFPTLVQYECMVRCLLDHAHGRQTAGDAVNPTDAANGNEETSPQNAVYANV